ncbi:MAG: hypothetical protein U1E46_07025 [Hyphomicrobiales bacterium]
MNRVEQGPPGHEAVGEAERIAFLGDEPIARNGRRIDSPCGVDDYVGERLLRSNHQYLVCLPSGAVFHGAAYARWLSYVPNQRPIFGWTDLGAPRVVRSATIVSVDHGITYGDWVSEYLRTLIDGSPIGSVVLVPGRLRHRKYVSRDLEQLGIDFQYIDVPTILLRATVLHKKRYLVRWTKADVQAFRSAFGIATEVPRAGSVLYLSREGVPQMQWHPERTYPHADVSRLVQSLGGQTLSTHALGPSDYKAARHEAETVIADHGSAMLNLLYWQTKSVIELVTDGWWGPGMMSLAKACGVRNYAIVRVTAEATPVETVRDWVHRFQASTTSLWD